MSLRLKAMAAKTLTAAKKAIDTKLKAKLKAFPSQEEKVASGVFTKIPSLA